MSTGMHGGDETVSVRTRRLLAVPPRGIAAIALLAIASVCAAAPASALARPLIESFSATPSTTQAGGHPDVEFNFHLENRGIPTFLNTKCDCEDPKDVTVHLPTGLIGNPHATPQCSLQQFAADQCPIDSQVGVAYVGVYLGNPVAAPFFTPVYNLEPPPGEAGLTGFKAFLTDTPQYTVLSTRTGTDYGLDATSAGIEHLFPLTFIEQTLWGVPASPAHDSQRYPFGGEVVGGPFLGGLLPHTSSSPQTPFLQNPTSCSTSLSSALEVETYTHETAGAESPWPAPTGCDQLSFDPTSTLSRPLPRPTRPPASTSTCTVPQELSPTVPSPSEIRAATVTLPDGFSINPNAADGKTACTDAEARLRHRRRSAMPRILQGGHASRIESAALPGPLPGFVYLGEPKPGDRYRIFLVANGFGIHIKLAGIDHRPTPGRAS